MVKLNEIKGIFKHRVCVEITTDRQINAKQATRLVQELLDNADSDKIVGNMSPLIFDGKTPYVRKVVCKQFDLVTKGLRRYVNYAVKHDRRKPSV